MTIYEIAKMCGVSTATVSRVINGQPGVGEAKRLEIQGVIDRLGYLPNLIARDLSTKTSLTAGLVLPGINSYFSPAVQAISQVLRERNIHLLIVTNPGGVFDDASEAEGLQLLLSKRVRGVILFVSALTERHRQVLRKWPADVELVLVNQDFTEGNHSVVTQEAEPGYRQLFQVLQHLPHPRLAFIGGPAQDGTSRLRLALVRSLAREYGFDFPAEMAVDGGFDLVSGERGVEELRRRGPFNILICANDFTAIGALKALKKAGVQVPQDIAVVGYDGLEIASFTSPALTTIDQNVSELGREAARLLIERLDDPESPAKKLALGSRLLRRESL